MGDLPKNLTEKLLFLKDLGNWGFSEKNEPNEKKGTQKKINEIYLIFFKIGKKSKFTVECVLNEILFKLSSFST